MGSQGTGDPSEDPSNMPTTRFDAVPLEAQSQSLPGANLCKRVHLDSTPAHGPFPYPVAKAPHLDHQTGAKPQILHPY